MPSFFSYALPLALASSALANPLMRRDDACLAAVTGYAALGDPSLRASHCSSFIKTIVTPAATTVTVTITGAPTPTDNSMWNGWKREIDQRDVTVCPNEVPNYASACNEAAYKSACSVWGIAGDTTFTIPATTTTETWYVGGVCTSTAVITSTVSACSGGTTTATVTVGASTVTSTSTSVSTDFVAVGGGSISTVTTTATSVSTSTVTAGAVTVTVTAGASVPSGVSIPTTGNCLTDDQANAFVAAFTDLLEYTNYNGTAAPPGRGYHYNVSAKYLASDFQDYSDSINWMAGFKLGGVTFDGRASFDYGQGSLQPELTMTTLGVEHSCKAVHWRWSALTSSGANVRGINFMEITDDLTQIQTNYAEFDNANWIESFAKYNPTLGISCVVPGGDTQSAKRSVAHTY